MPAVTSVTDVRDGRLCAACDREDRQGMPPRRGIGLRTLRWVGYRHCHSRHFGNADERLVALTWSGPLDG